jgi:C1A family cysteine protease
MQGYGWLPDLPDFRDYTYDHPAINPILTKSQHLTKHLTAAAKRPATVDLRQWCSPIENQGNCGSCTSHAGIGLLEWYQRRAFGKHIDMSRLFLYKVTRNLMGVTGDQGAFLRTTIQSMAMIGAPPERNYPYNINNFDKEPSAFVYSLAQNYKSIKYYRITPVSGKSQLDTLLDFLAGGLPFMFGFTVYSSISNNAMIPYPKPGDYVEGGHAIMAVGYDETKKCFIIRNSWGTEWGDKGYGYLPFSYISSGLADDFWGLVQADFVDTDLFKA